MKFPKLSELDRDQNAIYNGAPVDGSVVISGPPGTGKTVIAFHRAHTLAAKKRNPRVIVFNKVLAKYTSNRDKVAPDVNVSTLHQWVAEWWRLSGMRGHAPAVPGAPYDHDWETIGNRVLQRLGNGGNANAFNWGHLVIDEGQDFPVSMYSTLRAIREVGNHNGAQPPMAISVLADENQRLQPLRNSTLPQICGSLGVGPKETYHLKKNYRNTKEIAAFAACFYVGLKGGIPDPPTRTGPKPVVSMLSHDTEGQVLNACVDKISRYAIAHPAEEIGVIAMKDKDRQSLCNRLEKRLGADVVQTYSRRDQPAVHALTFDQPGRVTVLNYQSAKGLEFDAVFLVDPGQLIGSGSSELNVRMVMYVMSSRARNFLDVMLVDDEAAATLLGWVKDESLFFKESL